MNTKTSARTRRTKASAELTAAAGRVGLSAEDRARWLVNFARRRMEYQTRALEGESLAARWDALAFAYGRRWSIDQDAQPPTWSEVTTAHMRLSANVLGPLRNGQPIQATWVGHLFPQPDGSVRALTTTSDLAFVHAFMVQVYDVLRGLAESGLRLRFCPVCTRPYVSKRADAKVCPAGSCRTLAWRRSHREKFKELRREAYRRLVVKKTGNPNVRIQRRAKED